MRSNGREVVRPRRFELLTYSFGGCRSIQLSYGRTISSVASACSPRHSEALPAKTDSECLIHLAVSAVRRRNLYLLRSHIEDCLL